MIDHAPRIRERAARRAALHDAVLAAVLFPALLAECYVLLAMLTP